MNQLIKLETKTQPLRECGQSIYTGVITTNNNHLCYPINI